LVLPCATTTLKTQASIPCFFVLIFGIVVSRVQLTLASSGLAHCEKTQPLALFFGSGQQPPQHEPRVPFELQWSISSLTRKIDSGVVTPLSVVEAIKTAMPADWLASHRMSTDSVSVAFSSSDQDILDLYKAALNA